MMNRVDNLLLEDNVAGTLELATARLMHASPSPRLDAEVLLMHVAGISRAELLAYPERRLQPLQRRRLKALLERRRRGEPVAYLRGTREFWSMELRVSRDTLIPRPETELLVEQALERIPKDAESTVFDIGTGCGAIALALAKERPRCRIFATDCSAAALRIARRNIIANGLTRVQLRAGEWFAALASERAHLIVCNPPYIRRDDPHLKLGDVRFEPECALIAGADGLDAIRHVVQHARYQLHDHGWLLLEHAYNQGPAVAQFMQHCGYREIHCYRDGTGLERVSAGRLC
jgi:release factor glutamine methyltransferase